jgi:ribose transport system ATP-binding protein
MESAVVLQFDDIVKSYPGVLALNHVNLNVRKGEIHALVGENGAGKSTLIKCCTGAESPTSGTITVNGRRFSSFTPKLSAENGIVAIYQEFNLVGELSVAENIFMGRAIRKGILINKKVMHDKALQIFNQLSLKIDPDELVKNMAVGYQQLIEIAKALSQNARILIMDEPTAPLTKNEVDILFSIIEKLKEQGMTIIYISHRMDEIFKLSDRITILRDGTKIKTIDTKDTNVNELIRLMVGRSLNEKFPKRNTVPTTGEILSVEHLYGNGLTDVSFKIYGGEILGFAGLIGSGRTETAQILFGIKKKSSGKIVMNKKEISPKSPREAMEAGLALVPEDRKQQGVLLGMSIYNNITLTILHNLSTWSIIRKHKDKATSALFQKKLNIKTPSPEQLVKNLSGGNQQKVVVAKWLAADSDLIIMDEPTRGIDVGAKYEIYKLMNNLVEEGKTILMISSEMEELIGMADRIVVLSEGRVTGTITKDGFNQEAIMKYASQVRNKE